MSKVNVLFVCLGNICRSPTAHGVFRDLVQDSGLADVIGIDSCGTGGWHVGAKPDKRATAAAKQRGYDLSDLRARQLERANFNQFDYILVMDKSNLRDSKQLMPSSFGGELALFLDYADGNVDEVPDPYYGGDDGFEYVLDLIESASRNLIKHIQRNDLN